MCTIAIRALSEIGHPIRMIDGAGEILVGRGGECQVRLPEPSVSRRHARLVPGERSVSLFDLDSTNGTFVDGERVRSATISGRHELRFGRVACQVDIGIEELLGSVDSRTTQTFNAWRDADMKPPVRLTNAQSRVMALLERGLSEKQIAGRLGVAGNTVHTHVRAIYRVFAVRSRAELLAKVLNRLGGQMQPNFPWL